MEPGFGHTMRLRKQSREECCTSCPGLRVRHRSNSVLFTAPEDELVNSEIVDMVEKAGGEQNKRLDIDLEYEGNVSSVR